MYKRQVFSWVLSISTGFVRFNLGSLPVLLAALLFGPGAGFAVGAVAEMCIRDRPYLITFSPFLMGFTIGLSLIHI